MDLHASIVRYLLDGYVITEDKAHELADGIEFYLVDCVIPDTIRDAGIKMKGLEEWQNAKVVTD